MQAPNSFLRILLDGIGDANDADGGVGDRGSSGIGIKWADIFLDERGASQQLALAIADADFCRVDAFVLVQSSSPADLFVFCLFQSLSG